MRLAESHQPNLRVAVAAAVVATLILGGLLQWSNIRATGSTAALLRVGAQSALRPVIEEELGPIPLARGEGHDGQFYFLSALDPLLLDHQRAGLYSSYRQRRVGLPILAGLGGLLPANVTLVGMVWWPVAGLALASGAAVALAGRQRRLVAVAGVMANPGLWMSVALVTADTLALGLALSGLVAVRRRRLAGAAALFVAAALTKETHLVFALAAGAWFFCRRDVRSAAVVALVPTLSLGAWMLWVRAQAGASGVGTWNFGLPFGGIAAALPQWSGGEALLSLSALGAVVAGTWALVRSASRLIRFNLAPWLLLAILTAEVVWRDGNNAARVLAPLLTLAAVGAVAAPDAERLLRKSKSASAS